MVYALNVQAAMFYVIMCVYILCKRCPLWIVPSRFKCIVTSFLLTLLTTGQTYSFILRNMSHTIYAAKFEQTIIHQHVHLRRESLSHAPAHVVMRLYPIDKSLVFYKAKEGRYVRICINFPILSITTYYRIFRYQDLVEIFSVSEETMINDAFSYSENV